MPDSERSAKKMTAEDLAQLLDTAKSSLYALPIPSETEIRGVVVKRTGPDTYEYKLQLGETHE